MPRTAMPRTAMPKTAPERQRSRTARRGGNLVSIIINAVLLYLLNAHPGWRSLSFLTPATVQVIGLVNLNLAAGIAANVLYFIAEPPWLRAIGDLATLIIALVTSVRIWQVFPFAFHGSMAFWSTIVRVLLIIGVAGACIGIIASAVRLTRSMAKLGR